MRKPASARTIGIGLVVGHLVIAAALAIAFINSHRFAADQGLFFAIMLGSSIAEAGLIGLWAGLANTRLPKRLAGALAGGGAVYAVPWFALQMWSGRASLENWLFPVVSSIGPLLAIGAFSAVLRRRRFSVERLIEERMYCNRRGVRFSLSHLFAITLVAAVLFALVREIRSNLPGPPDALRLSLAAAFNALLFVLHTQICLWSALGTGRSLVRLSAIALSTAIAAGIGGLASGGKVHDFQSSVGVIGVFSTLVAGSLWILRWFGYRLTRRSMPPAATQEE